LKLRIDVNSLSYPPELNQNELVDAKKIIKNISGKMFKVFIEPPIELKALISGNVQINGSDADSDLLSNKIKSVISGKGIEIVSYRNDANMRIQADVQIYNSSYNEYLGFCYKASGSLRISGNSGEVIIKSLNDIDTEEETKSFDKSKDQSTLQAYRKICDLLANVLSEMTF
jgi:hypothetical protein